MRLAFFFFMANHAGTYLKLETGDNDNRKELLSQMADHLVHSGKRRKSYFFSPQI